MSGNVVNEANRWIEGVFLWFCVSKMRLFSQTSYYFSVCVGRTFDARHLFSSVFARIFSWHNFMWFRLLYFAAANHKKSYYKQIIIRNNSGLSHRLLQLIVERIFVLFWFLSRWLCLLAIFQNWMSRSFNKTNERFFPRMNADRWTKILSKRTASFVFGQSCVHYWTNILTPNILRCYCW